MEPKEHKHKTFSSGAQRSDRAGKGRFDLISPFGLARLAIQYEEGSKHHEDARNWERGFPISRALCSAMGHINDHMKGDRSEDHLAAASWQLFAAMEFEERIGRGELPVVLNDVPFDANTLPPDTGAAQNTPESVVSKQERKDNEPSDNFPFARMVEEPFGEIQRMTGAWADTKFPKTDSVAICKHLEREIDELSTAVADDAAISIIVEAADCLLLLMHLAHKGKFNLLTATIDKYVVNLSREWAAEPDAEGIYPHIDELRKVAGWERFDAIVKVDIPAGAEVWADPAIYEAVVQGQMRGEIVKIDGKFILRERKDSTPHERNDGWG